MFWLHDIQQNNKKMRHSAYWYWMLMSNVIMLSVKIKSIMLNVIMLVFHFAECRAPWMVVTSIALWWWHKRKYSITGMWFFFSNELKFFRTRRTKTGFQFLLLSNLTSFYEIIYSSDKTVQFAAKFNFNFKFCLEDT